MKNNPTVMGGWQPVVAAALRADNGLWLMHRRPLKKHHGGLWEFPGGKVEQGEVPENALFRELNEELAIAVSLEACVPSGFAQEAANTHKVPIVILLYTVTSWQGEPISQEGGEVGWFNKDELLALKKPPLDYALERQLFRKVAS